MHAVLVVVTPPNPPYSPMTQGPDRWRAFLAEASTFAAHRPRIERIAENVFLLLAEDGLLNLSMLFRLAETHQLRYRASFLDKPLEWVDYEPTP